MVEINRPPDPVGEVLHCLRMSGIFYSRCELTAPWGLTLPPFVDCMMFHIVVGGRLLLAIDGAVSCELERGDLALVPHGEGHQILSAPGVAAPGLFEVPRTPLSEKYELIRLGGGGAPTTLICGVVRFDQPTGKRLLASLPRVIRTEARDAEEADWLESTVRFIAAEARELRAGGETIITRLADVLVIHAIRSWMAREPASLSGWFAALREPGIGRAIACLHRDPGHRWTLTSLAAEAAMSRSTFAARFTELVGEPAMQYAARWKMQTAALWMSEGDVPIAQVADRLGYESEAAFRRAFKRFMGRPPGALRRAERATP